MNSFHFNVLNPLNKPKSWKPEKRILNLSEVKKIVVKKYFCNIFHYRLNQIKKKLTDDNIEPK